MSGTRSKRGGQDEDSDVEMLQKPTKASGDEEEKRGLILSPGGTPLHGLNGLRSRHGGDKPAELFRKDLISAMKLADTDALNDEDFYLISDPWRQEWERGVQVPVNPDNIPIANGKIVEANSQQYGGYAFKHPRKLMHAMQDEGFKREIHELHEMHKLAEQVFRYDLDDHDVHWLISVNDERDMCGDLPVEEWQMEKVMEELETQCHANMQVMIKTVEGLGIEYDENIVCDVCRSPDSEDSNEMVFCDQCDICVHQACYGVQNIPEGNWLCRICTLGIRPPCVLCPKTGGAMKSTKSGSKWAHVSCSLWIPEVSIGCPEKMEPITRISHIPSSRWSLVCSQCRERTGACIQCSVKTCKTAFHVTCAFQHGLEMKTILEEDDEEIQLKAYCAKHTKKRSEADGGTPRKDPFLTSTGAPKKECEMTEEEKKELRSHRLKKLAEEFYTCVKVPEVAQLTQMEEEVVDFIYNYWLLKRKSNFNKPLLTPKTEEEDLLSKQQEDCLIARMRMFVHLRQNLERVRNLCYMVTKREKVTRTMNRLKEEIFLRQILLVNESQAEFMQDFKEIPAAHKSCKQLYDDYEKIFKSAQDDADGKPLITEPIDHKLDAVRPWKPGRPKLVGTLRREGTLDAVTDSLRARSGSRRRQHQHHHHQRNKSKEILHSQLRRNHRKSGLDHDKEQVDPRKVNKTEVIRRRHSDQKWAASKDKAERRTLFNRRRLSDSNIARQKQRLGKYEKRTTGRGRAHQTDIADELTTNPKDAISKQPETMLIVTNTVDSVLKTAQPEMEVVVPDEISMSVPEESLVGADTSMTMPEKTVDVPEETVKVSEETVHVSDKAVKVLDKSVKIPDKSVKVPDKSVKVPDKSVKVQDISAKIPDISAKIPDKSAKVTDKSAKVTDKSVKLSDKSVKVPDKSVKVSDKNVKVPDKSVKVPDKIVKMTDKIVKVSDKSVKMTDKIVKVSDKIVKVTDKIVKVTDKNVKVTDKSVKLSDKPINVPEKNVNETEKPVKVSEKSEKPVKVSEKSEKPVKVSEKSEKPVKVSEKPEKNVKVSEKLEKSVKVTEKNVNVPEKNMNAPVSEESNDNGPNRKLVVVQSIRERVQSRLHRSLPINGLHDQTSNKIEKYFKPVPQSNAESVKTSEEEPAPVSKKLSVVLNKAVVKIEAMPLKDIIMRTVSSTEDVSTSQKLASDVEKQELSLKRFAKESVERPSTPETRGSKRRKTESDAETNSNTSDKPFEVADCQMSVQSSRGTTPEIEVAGPKRRSCRISSDVPRLCLQKLDLRTPKMQVECINDNAPVVGDTEEFIVDVEGSSGPSVRTRRSTAASAAIEAAETGSVDSINSSGSKGSKYSTRSRTSIEQSGTTAKLQNS